LAALRLQQTHFIHVSVRENRQLDHIGILDQQVGQLFDDKNMTGAWPPQTFLSFAKV